MTETTENKTAVNEEINKKKHTGGRPKIEIDYEKVEELAAVMCTEKEIAAVLGVSLSKLKADKEFMATYKKGIEASKASLRHKQFVLSDKNPAMAIFLGKNYLGQADKDTTKVDATVSISLSKDLEKLGQ